ncbi:MAG: hypothetical protein ACRECX_12575 [Methyloceanibacter sp.]|uniref:hypothetical protein n=1 Tax=Methyloceanibacter sp. TaxID=1965321 RepID=UPI003D6CFCA1
MSELEPDRMTGCSRFPAITIPRLPSGLLRVAALGLAIGSTPIVPLTAHIVDGADSRTEQQFAEEHGLSLEEVQRLFAATGKLECNGKTLSTAQLTVWNDVITAAGHALWNDECQRLSEPEQCTFQLSGRKPVRVSELIATGLRCPDKFYRTDDWLVLKLEQAVEDVKPYQIANRRRMSLPREDGQCLP